MENNLYFIANEGCDDTTHGLAIINDEDFPKFKSLIEDLNKNSTYWCMPTISVYKISMSDLREINYNPNAGWGDDGYVDNSDKSNMFFLGSKTYTFAKKSFSYYNSLERVIGGK
jgi:hypothetical protein